MKEQQSTQFYDKLLNYLNKTFVTNYKTQELYLDLSRNTRKLKFRSIKSIYTTLTQGKAEEIIYTKDKPNIVKAQIYDQIYTKQLCWRLIEKLIMKIAYYLTYQRNLKDLAPYILKAISFTRKATDKINNKASFIQFFSESVDLLIKQNNILAKKIYQLLIDRGYICSVEEFYKLSRFESDKDFIYSLDSQNEEQLNEPVIESDKPITKLEETQLNTSKFFKGSRKGIFSSRKDPYRSSILKSFGIELEIDRVKNDIENISEDEDFSQISEGSSYQSSEEDVDRTNKINHSIHNQVEKFMEQFTNHPNYQTFLSSVEEEHQKKNQYSKQKIEPPIKQIIRNLRLKNYKANEKILQIKENNMDHRDTERKNSKQKMEDSKKKMNKKKKFPLKNRPSIANVISNRMKENVFKLQGVQSIENLVIRNLKESIKKDNILEEQFEKLSTFSGNQHENKIFKRTNKRQNTYTAETSSNEYFKSRFNKNNKNNIDFLSNAFVFKKGNNRSAFYKKRLKTTDVYMQNEDGDYSNKYLDTVLSNNLSKTLLKGSKDGRQNNETSVFSNQKINQAHKRSGFEIKKAKKKIWQKDHRKFNTAILQFAAKKYHRYSSEGPDHFDLAQEAFNINQLLYEGKNGLTKTTPKMFPCNKSKEYLHDRKFEVYDRRNRKFL